MSSTDVLTLLCWCLAADFSRTNNINVMLSTLWPSITEAITQQFVMQMVPQMMADAAKNYGAGVLTGLELLEFDLGAVSRGLVCRHQLVFMGGVTQINVYLQPEWVCHEDGNRQYLAYTAADDLRGTRWSP
jgi:hypothetical protein